MTFRQGKCISRTTVLHSNCEIKSILQNAEIWSNILRRYLSRNLFTTICFKILIQTHPDIGILKIINITFPSSDDSISIFSYIFHFITQATTASKMPNLKQENEKFTRHFTILKSGPLASNRERPLLTGLTVIKRFISSFTHLLKGNSNPNSVEEK